MPFKVSYTSARLYKYLTPGEFLSLMKSDRGSIKKSKFIAPRPGSFSMGKIYVEYNYEPNTRLS
jgi:hypothetical protein